MKAKAVGDKRGKIIQIHPLATMKNRFHGNFICYYYRCNLVRMALSSARLNLHGSKQKYLLTVLHLQDFQHVARPDVFDCKCKISHQGVAISPGYGVIQSMIRF